VLEVRDQLLLLHEGGRALLGGMLLLVLPTFDAHLVIPRHCGAAVCLAKTPTAPTNEPEVVEFAAGVVKNGLACMSSRSVWLGIAAFDQYKGQTHGKLLSETVGQSELLIEEEGALTVG
jgi:hypothetical protein